MNSKRDSKKLGKSSRASRLVTLILPYVFSSLSYVLPHKKFKPAEYLKNFYRDFNKWALHAKRGEKSFVFVMSVTICLLLTYCLYLPMMLTLAQKSTGVTSMTDSMSDYLDPEAQTRALISGSATVQLPILMYHRIAGNQVPNDPHSPILTVSPSTFEAQLEYLKTNGYHTVILPDLYRAMYEGQPLPDKPVLLTFDDGYANNYTDAFPLLKKYGLKATVFVITNRIDHSNNYLSSAQIREMQANGFEIEAHTKSHPQLPQLSPRKAKSELAVSKRALENILGKKVYFLAYPFGDYNPEVALEAKLAGYLLALTTKKGSTQKSDAPYDLLRYYVGPNTTMAQFQKLID